MRLKSKSLSQELRNLPWLGVSRFLFVVVLTGLFFLLAHSMVKHRFFRGGWMNHSSTLQP